MPPVTDDNRQQPRYRAFVPLHISKLQLHTINVSASGLQLSCPELMMKVLQPEFEKGAVQIDLNLPGQQTVQVNALMVYMHDFGDEKLIGLEFTGFLNGGESAYTDYIRGLAEKQG